MEKDRFLMENGCKITEMLLYNEFYPSFIDK